MYLLNLDSFLGSIDPIYQSIDFKLFHMHECLYVKRIYYNFLHPNIIVRFFVLLLLIVKK